MSRLHQPQKISVDETTFDSIRAHVSQFAQALFDPKFFDARRGLQYPIKSRLSNKSGSLRLIQHQSCRDFEFFDVEWTGHGVSIRAILSDLFGLLGGIAYADEFISTTVGPNNLFVVLVLGEVAHSELGFVGVFRIGGDEVQRIISLMNKTETSTEEPSI